jgi:hypothetical protein
MTARIPSPLPIAAALLACALLALPAAAQNAPPACGPDIAQYCPGVQQGEGRIAKCLGQNKDKLAPACKEGMAHVAMLLKEVVAACEDDIHQFCSGAAPGTTKDCLRTHFRQLSSGCKRELFEAKKGM